MTNEKQPVFLSDTPCSLTSDMLWQQDENEIGRRIQEIVDTILQSDEPLTFAVHGSWGSGKTSFLRMVEGSLHAHKGEQTIDICWYNASAYQKVHEPAITLTVRILDTMGGNDPVKSSKLYQELVDRFPVKMVSGNRRNSTTNLVQLDLEGSTQPFELIQSLAEKMAVLTDLGRLLEKYLSGEGPVGSAPRKLILMVDDLDRCSLEFIGDLVDFIQRLALTPGVFVIMAVDQDRLWKALEKRFEDVMETRGARWAAEKYVQHSVEIPQLDENSLKSLLKGLLQHERTDEDETTPQQAASALIIQESQYFAVGIPNKTPRLIKRCINHIRPRLAAKMSNYKDDSLLSKDELQKIIKSQLLAYVWPDFYNAYWLPATRYEFPARSICSAVERASRDYVSDIEQFSRALGNERRDERRVSFEHRLRKIRVSEGLTEAELVLPLELATLLGTPPFWFLGGDKGSDDQTFPFLGGDKGSGYQALNKDVDIASSIGVRDTFQRLYIRSEQADATDDGRGSVEAAANAYRLVADNKHLFDSKFATQLGNMGVNAEKYGVQELAEALFRLALDLNPYSAPVIQQFVSYINDNRPDLYPEAEQLLDKLQTQFQSHNPVRTLSLLVQLKGKRGETIDQTLIEQLMALQETNNNPSQLGFLLRSLIQAGQIEQGLRIFQATAKKYSGSGTLYQLMRVVADALANRPEPENERLAMDLYRQMLSVPSIIERGTQVDILHNYAMLLNKHDYDDEAGCLWFSAYKLSPTKPSIARAYSLYLLRANRPDLARQVADGQPLEGPAVLIKGSHPLPRYFSNANIPNFLVPEGESPTLFRCTNEE